MEAMVYPAIKILIVAILATAAFAYFMNKIGEKKLFKKAILAIIQMIVLIIGMLVITKMINNLQKTTTEEFNKWGNKNISSSSQRGNNK